MSTPAEQLPAQLSCYHILVWGSLLAILRQWAQSFFGGIGQTAPVLWSTLGNTVINLIASASLAYGWFGLPALGIIGTAYGTLIGSACGVGMLIWTMYRHHRNRVLSSRQDLIDKDIHGEQDENYGLNQLWSWHRDMIVKMLRFGTPAGAEMFINLVAFNVVILAYQGFGRVESAAITVAFNWDMVVFIPLMGMQIAITSLVGRAYGAQDLIACSRQSSAPVSP